MTTNLTKRDGRVGRMRATERGTYVFPVTSEAPYRRYDGIEILDHSEGAVDLTFMNSGSAPLLDSHNRYDGLAAQLGVVERAWLENKRVYVEVRFSNRAAAQEIKRDVDEGIISNVSGGYSVHEVVRNEDTEEYRVTKWTLKEASFVSIPADETVGVGRSFNKQEGVMPKDNQTPSDEGTRAAVTTMPGGMTDEQRGEAHETAINEITALAATHNIQDVARSFITGALQRGETPSLAVFRGIARANLPEDVPLRNTDIGLTQQEQRQFSVIRLAAAMRDGASQDQVRAAAFEIEACQAAAEQQTNPGRGMYSLPSDLMRSWNDFEFDGYRSADLRVRAPMATTGNPNVQDTDHLAARFIDNLRNRMVLGQLGITMLPGLDGNVEIPGGDTNIAAAWLAAEDADAAESVASFRKVELAIKDVAVYTDLTRRMLIQSTIAIEQYVRNQIVEAMAQAIDLAGFYGSGAAGVPEGIANTAGIGAVEFAADIPTRSEIIDMRTTIASTNRLGSPVFVGNSVMAGGLMKQTIDAGSGRFLMTGEGRLDIGNTYTETNQITDGDLFAGVFSDMFLGMWGSLELDRSTEAKFLSGGLRLRAIQSVDTALARVGSFVLGQNLVP